MISVGMKGQIKNSDRVDPYVLVKSDDSTDGFLAFEGGSESFGPNGNGAFDSWVESIDALERFFVETSWHVVWEPNSQLDSDASRRST